MEFTKVVVKKYDKDNRSQQFWIMGNRRVPFVDSGFLSPPEFKVVLRKHFWDTDPITDSLKNCNAVSKEVMKFVLSWPSTWDDHPCWTWARWYCGKLQLRFSSNQILNPRETCFGGDNSERNGNNNQRPLPDAEAQSRYLQRMDVEARNERM